MGEIFIIHATADAGPTARIAERIRQAGHSIFVDSDRDDGIAPGADWQRTTTRQPTATGTLAQGSPVYSVAFSPDGHTLAAEHASGNISLWDTTTRQPTATLAQGSPVSSVAFSPDGHTLAIGKDNGTVVLLRQRLSNLSLRYFMHLICGEVRENLTREQWATYVQGQQYQKTCPAYP